MTQPKPQEAPAPTDQTETPADINDGFKHRQISEIRASYTNRKRFNQEALAKLAENVAKVGVVQPILVRPVTPTATAPEIFEIVAGERRYRASVIAGLTTIPSMCRSLSDMEAAEIQIIENLQREDPHPMEEADGYQQLMMKHGYNADQLAAKVDKSRSYIYGRLKLCALTLDVREQFLDDKISASIALLIARIPVPALQTKALGEISTPSGWPAEPMSYRRAVVHVQNRYMLNLDDAPFALNDVKLLATAGACTSCPKRAGNQPEVFPDEDQANLCTDPDCFTEKRAAHDAKQIVIANKKGIPVIEGAAATATLGDLTKVFGDGALWKLDRRAPSVSTQARLDEVMTESQLPKPIAIVKLDNGKIRKLYDKAEVQAAAEKAGICETVEEQNARIEQENDTPERKAHAEKQARQFAAHQAKTQRAAALTQERIDIHRKVRATAVNGFSLGVWREMAKHMLEDRPLPDDILGDLYSLPDRTDESARAYIDQAPLAEVQQILFDMTFGESLEVNVYQIDKNNDLDPDYSNPYQALQALVPTDTEQPTQAAHDGIDGQFKYVVAGADIDVASMSGVDDITAYITANPERLDDLTQAIFFNAPMLINSLETAAGQLGYTYSTAGWSKPAEPATETDVQASAGSGAGAQEQETAEAAPAPRRKLAAKAKADDTSVATDAASTDPVIKVKKKRNVASAEAWPFPTNP